MPRKNNNILSTYLWK